MSDEFDLDSLDNYDGDDIPTNEFDVVDGEAGNSGREATTVIAGKSALEGMIGAATDNLEITNKVKNALPDSISENWETAEDLVDVADRAKDSLVNPIRKEMVSFKRNINKLTPMVKNYLGNGIGGKFDDLTKVREESEIIDPDSQELASTIGGIFSEEARQRIDGERKKMVWDLMERQTDEDRFKLQMTTMHDMMSAVKSADIYNKTVTYPFQQKSLEYDIKRFHILKQLLDVNTRVGESSVSYLKSIVHNTSLPDIIKQQNSELFKQMFAEKWYGETVEGLSGMGRGMISKLGKNLVTRAEAAAQEIVSQMSQLGDLAGTMGDMTADSYGDSDMDDMDGMGAMPPTDNKTEIAQQLGKMGGSSLINQMMDKMLTEVMFRNKDKDWFKNITALSDNVASNQNLFLRTFIDDMSEAEGGLKGMLAPMFNIIKEELPDFDRSMTKIGHHNSFKPTDPRQWDHQQRETVVNIIPGWLEKIHNLIADMMGESSNDVYNDKIGKFDDKDKILKDILDRITTDEQRTAAISEVDNLIGAITADVPNVGDGEQELLREWMIREASTSSKLDMRRLLNSDTFTDLSGYTEDLASSITTSLNAVYDKDKLYHVNRDSLKDREGNIALGKMDKAFRKVGGHYKDDQEVINDNLSGAGRSLLHDLKFLNDDGSINETEIIKFKLGTINPDGERSSLAEVLKKTPPPADKITPVKFDIPRNDSISTSADNGVPVSTGPPSSGESESSIRNLIDDHAPMGNGTSNMGNFNTDGGLTDNGLKEIIDSGVASLLNISSTNDEIRKSVRDISSKFDNPRASGKSEPLSEDMFKANDYLSGILKTLATMHKANISYYENVKNFDTGQYGLGAKIQTMLGTGLDFINGTFTNVGKLFKGLKGLGKGSFKAFRDGFSSRFSFEVADVYVGEETTPRIPLRDFSNVAMFNRKDGVVDPTPITKPDDIVGELVDSDNNVIITQQEFDDGLVRYNVGGKLKDLGKAFGGMTGKGVDLLSGSIRMAGAPLDLLKSGIDWANKKRLELKDAIKDVYIIGEDGKRMLLARVSDFKMGKLSVFVDGEYKTVKKPSDLFLGDIYKLGANGEPELVASTEDIKRGIFDVTGKVFERGSELIGRLKKEGSKLGHKVIDLVKMPFTIFGNMWKTLKAKFEMGVLEKIVLNIPKDIMIEANVVYLSAKNGNLRKGAKGGKDKVDNVDIPTSNKSTSPVKDTVDTAVTSIKSSPKFKELSKRYTDLVDKGRHYRAEGVLKAEFGDKWEEIRDKITNSETYAKGEEVIKPKYEKVADKVTEVKDDVAITVDDIREQISENGVKKTVSDKVEEIINNNDLAKNLKERLTTRAGDDTDTGETKQSPIGNKSRKESYNESFLNLAETLSDKFKRDKDESPTDPSIKPPNGLFTSLTDHISSKFNEMKSDKESDKESLSDKIAKMRENQAERAKAKQDAKAKRKADRKDAKDKRSRDTLLGKLLMGGGLLLGVVGKLTTGIMGIGKNILGIGMKLGGLVGKGIWQVLSPLLSVGLKGLGGLAKGTGGLLKKGAHLAVDGAILGGKKVGKVVGRMAGSQAAKVAGRFAAKQGLKAIAGLALAATPLGWAVGVAAVGWTAWEVTTGVLAYFDRRKTIKVMEYLRHIEYGVISGDSGVQEENKIAMRYFESEMISRASKDGDVIKVEGTSMEIWEEYASEFGDVGDDAQRDEFIKWYEHRFLPVLYKWMSLVYKYNEAYKSTKEEGFFGGKKDLSLTDMEDGLTAELKMAVARESLVFDELDFDPFKSMSSPSATVRCVVSRTDCRLFVDKIEKFLKPKLVGGEDVAITKADKKSKNRKERDNRRGGHTTDDSVMIVKSKRPRNKRGVSVNTVDAVDIKTPNEIDNPGDAPSNFELSQRDGGYVLTRNAVSAIEDGIINYIKTKEGFSDEAYYDHKQYSIGYGTRTTDRDEIAGKPISEEEATRRLTEWVNRDKVYIRKLGDELGYDWTDNEVDALASFTYNLGRGQLRKLIRNRSKEQIARMIPAYNKASGVTSLALVKRRKEEAKLFASGRKDYAEDKSKLEVVGGASKSKEIMNTSPYKRGDTQVPKDKMMASTKAVRDKDASRVQPIPDKEMSPIVDKPSEVVVTLPELPNNDNLESGINEGNTLASDSLKVQKDTNDNIRALVKVLSKNSPTQVPHVTPPNQSAKAPPRRNVTVPSNGLTISPVGKYG